MKVAFICSGGGSAAIESIGAMMESLRDNHGIVPDKVFACSGGAIPSSLYLKGVSILDICKEFKVSSVIEPNSLFRIINGQSALDNIGLKKLLEELVGYEFMDNLVVNVTKVADKRTCYVKGNCITVLASSAYPEVLPKQILSVDGYEYDYVESGSEIRELKKKYITLDAEPCIDGGIYDVIPIPDNDELKEFDKVYVLVCTQSDSGNTLNGLNRVERVIDLLSSTLEREYHEVLTRCYHDDKFVILRPPKIESPLFEWSTDLCCYHESYDYIKNLKLT